MATSETDIVNAALVLIGGKRISSLTDGTKNANAANDLYDGTRDKVLREHTWDFAKKLTSLAQLSTEPTFAYDNAYALPADWIRTISVHDNDAGLGQVTYEEGEIEGVGALLTSVEQVFIRYVYRVTDPNRFSEDFRRALETALARDLSVRVANSNTLRATFEAQAAKELRKAKSSDSQASPPVRRPVGSWAASRQVWPSTRWPR